MDKRCYLSNVLLNALKEKKKTLVNSVLFVHSFI